MSRRRQQVLLCLLLGSLLLVLLRIAWPFASSLVLAVLLATVLGPANYRLIRILRRRGLASLLTTLATVIVMEVIFGFVCYRVVKDAMKIQHTLNQRSVEEGGWGAMVAHSTDRIADALATRLPVSKEIARGKLRCGDKVRRPLPFQQNASGDQEYRLNRGDECVGRYSSLLSAPSRRKLRLAP